MTHCHSYPAGFGVGEHSRVLTIEKPPRLRGLDEVMTQWKKHQPHKIHNYGGWDIIIVAGFRVPLDAQVIWCASLV